MVIQTTVPQAGSNVTITIPLTAVTVKGSLKATYSSENISADEMDDLRKTDYVTKEDLDKAIKENTTQPTWENVVLPSVKIWMAIDQNSNPVLATYRGLTIGLTKQDNYHSDIGQVIARNSSNPTQDEDGIDIMSITFPEQVIKVPATHGQEDVIDILIGQITQPTLAEYRAFYGSAFSTARQSARSCTFYSTDDLPYRARVRVKRYKGVRTGGDKYDYIQFAEDPTRYSWYGTGPLRTMVLYNGLTALINGYSTNPYPPTPRIPYVWLPMPGQIFDLEPSHTTTYKKWCFRYTRYVSGDIRIVPSAYIEYR
jgi:hypothetical protein